MKTNCVVCQKTNYKGVICRDCADKYGPDRNKWPAWLKFLVQDQQRELKSQERYNHTTIQLYDED